jgi:hypothetical protein
MAARWTPNPQERFARQYRRAQIYHDREPEGHYERAGYAYPEGYRGAYAERPGYRARRGRLYPPEPEGSGWPSPLHRVDNRAEERHLRAYRDRDLARSIDAALYNALGPAADRIAIYADDAVITLEGMVPHPVVARDALETAWRVPGVYRVRNALSWRGSERPGAGRGTSQAWR